ncbi:hypothetical protein EDD22DRAFT_1052313 [Suillus occidentalis]|nr:hypothetical protein EDD22DRAFT_1052313 [Suillus occidentalis]
MQVSTSTNPDPSPEHCTLNRNAGSTLAIFTDNTSQAQRGIIIFVELPEMVSNGRIIPRHDANPCSSRLFSAGSNPLVTHILEDQWFTTTAQHRQKSQDPQEAGLCAATRHDQENTDSQNGVCSRRPQKALAIMNPIILTDIQISVHLRHIVPVRTAIEKYRIDESLRRPVLGPQEVLFLWACSDSNDEILCKAVLANRHILQTAAQELPRRGTWEGDPSLTSPACSQVVMLPAKANSTITKLE